MLLTMHDRKIVLQAFSLLERVGAGGVSASLRMRIRLQRLILFFWGFLVSFGVSRY